MIGHRKNHEIEWLATTLQLLGVVVVAWTVLVETRPMVQNFAVAGAVIVSICGLALMSNRRQSQGDVSKNTSSVQPLKPGLALPRTSTKIDATAAALHRVRPAAASAEKTAPAASSGLIEKLHALDPAEFEMAIDNLFRNLGYRIVQRGGTAAGTGIDLVIEQGGQLAAVQCKHWKKTDVRVRGMREFIDAIQHAGIRQGISITPHGFTNEARELAAANHIEILTGMRLAQLLEESSTERKSTGDTEHIANLQPS
jgi:restriction endonuclease Mrr